MKSARHSHITKSQFRTQNKKPYNKQRHVPLEKSISLPSKDRPDEGVIYQTQSVPLIKPPQPISYQNSQRQVEAQGGPLEDYDL